MIIEPQNLRCDFRKIVNPDTGKVQQTILFPNSLNLYESRVGVTGVRVYCEVPSDVPAEQPRILSNAANLHNEIRSLNDAIPVLYVKTASMVTNYYEFHYVQNFQMAMKPLDVQQIGYSNPIYIVDIEFHCIYYKKTEKSAGIKVPTVQRFQIMDHLDDLNKGDISKCGYTTKILDPAEEHE